MITPSCDEILGTAKEHTTIPGLPRDLRRYDNADFAAAPPADPFLTAFSLLESVEGGGKWAALTFPATTRFWCDLQNGTVTPEGTVNKTAKTDKLPPGSSARCSASTAHRGSRVSRRSRAVSSATSRMRCPGYASRPQYRWRMWMIFAI